MATASWARKTGRTGFSRPIVALASVAVLMILLVLLRQVNDEDSSSIPSSNVPTPSQSEQCVAGGVDCAAPPLQLCVDARGARVDCSAVLAEAAQPQSSTSMGEWLLVGAVVLAPFVLVLGPLGWRAARRTRRRNAAAFASDAAALAALGFVAEVDPTPSVFAVEQARGRATRALARPGPPQIWLFEAERPSLLPFDGWPSRSAVMEPELPLPSGALLPMRERKGAGRYRGTFARSPEADALVRAVLPVLERRRGQVSLVVGGGVVELRSVAPQRVEPLALSDLAALAVEVAAALEGLREDSPV